MKQWYSFYYERVIKGQQVADQLAENEKANDSLANSRMKGKANDSLAKLRCQKHSVRYHGMARKGRMKFKVNEIA